MKKLTIITLVVLLLTLALAAPAFATPPTPAEGSILPTSEAGGFLTGTFDGEYAFVASHGRSSRLLFTGNVGEAEGTLLFNVLNIGPNGLGYWTILRGSGDLANLRGQGTFTFVSPTEGSYQGQIHFDPPS